MPGSRSALIVASYEYADPGLRQLHAPAADARALEAVLRDPDIGGFEVRTLLNAPAHEVSLAVEEFFADRRPDDLLLVHFSCHGVKDDGGDLYFAAANTLLRRLGATAVGASFVNRCMGRSRSRRIVLLLDCCYAGAFERGMTPRAGTGMGIEDHFDGRGRAVITASSAMEYAFEGEELADSDEPEPSVFTSALVRGLETGEADRDQDGLVALDELYDYIYDAVRARTPQQTPSKWTFGVQGELVIARRGRPVATPAPLPRELQQAIDSPLAAVRVAAVQELARLLTARHAGLALAAQLALERFTGDDSRMVAAAAAAALGNQEPPPATLTSPPDDLPAVLAAAEEVAPAPAEDPQAGLPGPPPVAVAQAAATPAEVIPGRGREAPAAAEAAAPREAVAGEAVAGEAVAGEAVAGEAPAVRVDAAPAGPSPDTPAPAVTSAAPAAADVEPPRDAAAAAAGSGRTVALAAPADRFRPAAAALAITAAILGYAGLSVTYQVVSDGSSYSLATYSWSRWYVVLGAAVDLVAGICLILPRTRRLIGPGVLLGNVAVSSGSLGFLVVSLVTSSGLGGGFWIEAASSLAEVIAACLAGVAIARTSGTRLLLWSARPAQAWIIIVLGAAGAVALVFHAGNLSSNAMDSYLPTVIWAAVMALIVPACATALTPRRFAAALLGGWIAADVAVFLYYDLFVAYQRGRGIPVGAVPITIFGLTLAALVPAVVLFTRVALRAEEAGADAEA